MNTLNRRVKRLITTVPRRISIRRQDLQTTEAEQNLLDGGGSFYTFTLMDAAICDELDYAQPLSEAKPDLENPAVADLFRRK